jgi:hypothetical protein
VTEPYLLTPVGVPNRPPRYILGPRLGPSYSELRHQLEQARERLDNESALRVRLQERSDTAARVLDAIARSHPQLREVVEQARKDIWNG